MTLKINYPLNLPDFGTHQFPNNRPTDAEIDILLQMFCGAMQVLISYVQLSTLCAPRGALSSLDTRKTEALMSFALLETVNRIMNSSDHLRTLIYISPDFMRTSLSEREQRAVTEILSSVEEMINLDEDKTT